MSDKKKLPKIDEDFFPAILKTRRMGYDGKGQSIINNLRSLTDLTSGI